MKRPKLIQICLVFLLCVGFVGWTTPVSSQERKDAAAVEKEIEKICWLDNPRIKPGEERCGRSGEGNRKVHAVVQRGAMAEDGLQC